MLATHLLCSSKKGISSHQLHRTLGVTYKTAWFMTHRIREAMRPVDPAPFGQSGGPVEIDETFIGTDKTKPKPKNGPAQKHKVLSLVDRSTGHARSMVIDSLKSKDMVPILKANIAREANVMTDGAAYYSPLSLTFKSHETVDHKSGEYVRSSNRSIHTNTIESFFSVFKRGMRGTYQHCGKQHLHRYLHEFDFRYCNRIKLGVDDTERALRALKGISGKRLTYRRTGAQA